MSTREYNFETGETVIVDPNPAPDNSADPVYAASKAAQREEAIERALELAEVLNVPLNRQQAEQRLNARGGPRR